MPDTCFPSPDSSHGWRRCPTDEDLREKTGFDARALRLLCEKQTQLQGGPWSIAIVRNGYLAAEWTAVPAAPGTAYHIWSCTKSITGLAFGMLFDDSRKGLLPGGVKIDLESPAYDFIPEGHPLSDPRKARIRMKHLLSMTSGIPGESAGILVLPVSPGGGEFEMALGREPCRFGHSAAILTAEPGDRWDYADTAFAHLSLIFANVSGEEIAGYMQRRVFEKIGIPNARWDTYGGGGCIGPHTSAGIGLHLSARQLARVGYLLAHRGRWGSEQIVPEDWIALATQSSQSLNPSYGYAFWVNSDGRRWPAAPRDAFALQGYASNRCYVVPSLDLVAVRLGYAPPSWNEDNFLPAILAALH